MILSEKLLKSIVNDYITLNSDAINRLSIYADLLVETNKQFNLTAITEPEDVTVKHFADSLSIFKYSEFQKGAKVIDVGTGAGFPGLAMLCIRPDLEMTFLDSTEKKLKFIENVLNGTGLKAEILHSRAEEAGKMSQHREKYDFATARAVANLSVLSELCLPYVKIGGTFISMKSASSDDEISGAKIAIETLGGTIQSDNVFDLVENVPRRIIITSKISQTPPKYPRSYAKIAKSPII